MTVILFAAAAATNLVTELEPVTVYASRIDSSAASMPAAVQVFGTREIASSGAGDLAGLLEKKANVQVRTLNGNPLQSQLAMRGWGENSFGRVKVTFNGEELNDVDMSAPDLARIPLGSVERVEVIHGPSPVLYGDGAVAGVVNVVSALPDGESVTRIAARAGSYGTAGAGFSTRGGDEVFYCASFDYLRSDGFRKSSAYDLYSAAAALRRTFDNGSYIGVKTDWANAFYEMPGALSYAQWKRDRRAAAYEDDRCRQWSAGGGFEIKAITAEDHALFFDGRVSTRRRRSSWGDYGYSNEYDLLGLFLSPRYVISSPVAGFSNRLSFGADMRYDRYGVDDASGFNNPEYRFDRMRGAAFVHDEFFLTDSFSLTAGARAENVFSRWNGYRGLADEDSCEWAGDFELGAAWYPAEELKTYAKLTRFHRSPFCDEMNLTRDGRPLGPEEGFSSDAGVDWNFAEEFSFAFDAYATLTDDEIFYNPRETRGEYGWNGYNCNSPSEILRLGFETAFGWKREKTAEASIGYGAVKACFLDGQYDGFDVPLVPAHRARAGAGVWIFDDLELKGECRYVSPQRFMGDFANDHGKLAGYTVFDAAIHYTPSWAEGWRASLTVENLFDRDYCDFAGWSDWSGAYFYPACGRMFLVSVVREF